MITVVAPPGRMGLQFGDWDGELAYISHVMVDSPLMDQLLPGDMIVALNGDDTSSLKKKQIVDLLISKSNMERVLTIQRLSPAEQISMRAVKCVWGSEPPPSEAQLREAS